MIPLALTLVLAAFVIRGELSVLARAYRAEVAAVERCFGHAALIYPTPRREVPLRDTVRFPKHRIEIY